VGKLHELKVRKMVKFHRDISFTKRPYDEFIDSGPFQTFIMIVLCVVIAIGACCCCACMNTCKREIIEIIEVFGDDQEDPPSYEP
jgi:hypothetical protein